MKANKKRRLIVKKPPKGDERLLPYARRLARMIEMKTAFMLLVDHGYSVNITRRDNG